jgi:hypothetical protein
VSSGHEVLILGAGFSKAVYHTMPLTDDLGNLCRSEITDDRWASRFPVSDFNDGYFESWLSRIAENQPDLSEEENLYRRAMFVRISSAIGTILAECQQSAMGELSPAHQLWLRNFLELAHEGQATLITFNYDTLIEAAVIDLALCGPRRAAGTHASMERVGWQDVVDHIPPPPVGLDSIHGETGFAPERLTPNVGSWVPTFSLLKLHGSINWYWSPPDLTGATMNRWEYVGRFGLPFKDADLVRERLLPGRVPFIVPPAAAKSSYYQNPVVRGRWAKARAALGKADRVVLIGYSMPRTDLVFSGMFWETVGVRDDVRIEVVNPNPDPVVANLEALGVPNSRILASHKGSECVADFASEYRAPWS